MATYNGIHIQHTDTAAIKGPLGTFLRRDWWRRGRNGTFLSWLCTVTPFLPWAECDDVVYPPEGGWSEIPISQWADRTKKLAEHLSATLNCRVMVLGYQTTAASQYIRICEEGKTVRLLWFAPGEDEPFEDEGEPLPFELDYIARRRRDVESELAALPEDVRGEEQWMIKRTSILPGCKEFAEAVGCEAFLQKHYL